MQGVTIRTGHLHDISPDKGYAVRLRMACSAQRRPDGHMMVIAQYILKDVTHEI